jgi:hypothetical protein
MAPNTVGRDLKQFVQMIDTARLNPDVSAMIPGRLDKKQAGSWQYELQKAVFMRQTDFACGLDGNHGAEKLTTAYAQDHFIMFRNQRTFGQMLQDTPPMRMSMWCGKGHGGNFFNLRYVGAPVSIKLIAGMVPGMMKKCGMRNVTYDCVAIYILPEWDMEKQGFIPDTWMKTGKAPENLEGRYALSFTLCNAQGTRSKDMKNNKNGRDGPKGETVICPFYEVHGNKISRGADGKLQVEHCLLSEYDDLKQETDLYGKPLPQEDNNMRIAFADYLAKTGVSCFTSPEDFDKGIAQFKEQFELATGESPTSANTSLLPPYL